MIPLWRNGVARPVSIRLERTNVICACVATVQHMNYGLVLLLLQSLYLVTITFKYSEPRGSIITHIINQYLLLLEYHLILYGELDRTCFFSNSVFVSEGENHGL
jgi:hypothetical protein